MKYFLTHYTFRFCLINTICKMYWNDLIRLWLWQKTCLGMLLAHEQVDRLIYVW